MIMKRILATILVLCVLLCCAARAEGNMEPIGNQLVVNCDNWVSMRSEPNTKAHRVTKVPLGAVVEDCYAASNGFAYGTYEGKSGYILMKYLTADTPEGLILDVTADGVRVTGARSYSDTKENLLVSCYADNGDTLWSRSLSSDCTELTFLEVFVAPDGEGSARVMLYSAMDGLSCCDLHTGDTLWTLPAREVHLGASISHAVGEDGTMYIGGYYGPDPVAISPDGSVLWQSSADSDDTYWLYEINLMDDCIAAHYDFLIDGDSGWVYYSYGGEKLGIERDE